MLGDVIRAERMRRGWSQSELARRAGLTQGHIHQLETGKRANPRVEVLLRLTHAFEMSADDLLKGIDSPVAANSEPEDALDTMLADLAETMTNLTHADREAVLNHARALRDQHKHGRSDR